MPNPYTDDGEVDVFEAHDSQRVKVTAASGGDSIGLRVWVTGTNDRDEAYRELESNLSNVLVIDERLPVVADSIDLRPAGHEIWMGEVEYVSPNKTFAAQTPKSVGEATFEFDGTGGTTRLFHAFEQRKYGDSAPDYGKWIAVNSEKKPEGVDIVVPQLQFTIHQAFDGPTITLPWLRQLVMLAGCTNKFTFLGFQPGEVLFLGPTGQQPLSFLENGQVVKGDRDVTFQFAVSPNLTGLEIDGIEDIEKRGHEYLWVEEQTSEKTEGEGESATKILSPKAKGVYVSEVYKAVDFAALGIVDPMLFSPVVGA